MRHGRRLWVLPLGFADTGTLRTALGTDIMSDHQRLVGRPRHHYPQQLKGNPILGGRSLVIRPLLNLPPPLA